MGETTVEQIPLPGIGLDYPGVQLDGEGGDVAAPLSQGQGGADPERQAVRECGEPMEIDPATIRLGMTTRRAELASERPDRQRRMTGERGASRSTARAAAHYRRRADYPRTSSVPRRPRARITG